MIIPQIFMRVKTIYFEFVILDIAACAEKTMMKMMKLTIIFVIISSFM